MSTILKAKRSHRAVKFKKINDAVRNFKMTPVYFLLEQKSIYNFFKVEIKLIIQDWPFLGFLIKWGFPVHAKHSLSVFSLCLPDKYFLSRSKAARLRHIYEH